MRIYRLFVLVLAVLASCKSINPDKPKYSGDPVPLPAATSQINIPIEIPISFLEENLNKDWSSKLFAEKDMPLGDGLFTDIDVIRTGKISLVGQENNTLKIRIPMNLKGDLKIEKKIFGQNLSTTMPFDENLQPEVSFIPEIGENWDLSLKNVQIESWGKSMKYNLLGFEIDLDPIVRKQVQKVLANQLTASNLSNLDFKSLAEKAWEAFAETRTIDQNGVTAYFYSVPTKIKLREQVTQDQKLKFFLGIEGELYSQVGNAPNRKAAPLPDISDNEDSTNRLDIVLPLAIRYEDLDGYLNNSLSGESIRMDSKNTLIPSNFKTRNFGDRTLLQMDFRALRQGKKEIAGQLYLVGKAVYDEETETIRFDDIDFDVNTKNILTRSAIRSKQGQILTQIRKYAAYPIGEYLEDARREMQQQGYFETDFATFRVKNPGLSVEGIYNTEADIRLYLKSSGQMEVNLKPLR